MVNVSLKSETRQNNNSAIFWLGSLPANKPFCYFFSDKDSLYLLFVFFRNSVESSLAKREVKIHQGAVHLIDYQ